MQGAKDPVLSLLWQGFDPWPRNFCMAQVGPKERRFILFFSFFAAPMAYKNSQARDWTFELIFVYGIRLEFSFILLDPAIQFYQHHLLKILSFSLWISLAPLSKINLLYMHVFISGLSILFHQSVCSFLYQYVPYCFYYYDFVIWFEIRKYDTSSFVLSQD